MVENELPADLLEELEKSDFSLSKIPNLATCRLSYGEQTIGFVQKMNGKYVFTKWDPNNNVHADPALEILRRYGIQEHKGRGKK